MQAYFTATPSRRTPPLFLGNPAPVVIAHSRAAAGRPLVPTAVADPAWARVSIRAAADPVPERSPRPALPLEPPPPVGPTPAGDPDRSPARHSPVPTSHRRPIAPSSLAPPQA